MRGDPAARLLGVLSTRAERSGRAAKLSRCATSSSASRDHRQRARKDGRDVWNISGGALLNALRTLGRQHQRPEARGGPGRRRRPRRRDHGAGGDPRRPSDPGLWKIDGYTKLVRLHRGDVRRHARARTSSSSPTTGAATTASPRAGCSARPASGSTPGAQSSGAARREARARRPLDGRPDLALLPRVPRRLARHAHAGHVRHAVPRLAGRARRRS